MPTAASTSAVKEIQDLGQLEASEEKFLWGADS